MITTGDAREHRYRSIEVRVLTWRSVNDIQGRTLSAKRKITPNCTGTDRSPGVTTQGEHYFPDEFCLVGVAQARIEVMYHGPTPTGRHGLVSREVYARASLDDSDSSDGLFSLKLERQVHHVIPLGGKIDLRTNLDREGQCLLESGGFGCMESVGDGFVTRWRRLRYRM